MISNEGYLKIIIGPMFAGKTTHLMNQATMFNDEKVPNTRLIVVNHDRDNRYTKSERLTSHDGRTMVCVKSPTLTLLSEELSMATHVIIDEGQFFPDLIPIVKRLVDIGKIVLIALLMVGEMAFIGSSYQLIPHADDIVMLKARCGECHCDDKASFSKRRNVTEPFTVGGAETYVSLCRGCWWKWEYRDILNGVVPNDGRTMPVCD